MEFGLKDNEISMIRDIFLQYPEVLTVKVFGSRATGNYRQNSDIDLVCWGLSDPLTISRIKEELDELNLPYFFDLQAYEIIKHEKLKLHIDTYAKEVYSRQ